MAEDSWVELSEAVSAIRGELMKALDEADGQPIRFGVQNIELEFSVDVRRSATAGGAVKAWVVSLDAKGERETTTGNRLKVMLTPQLKTTVGETTVKAQLEISDED